MDRVESLFKALEGNYPGIRDPALTIWMEFIMGQSPCTTNEEVIRVITVSLELLHFSIDTRSQECLEEHK